MTQTYLGDNLYTLRKQKGISQDEFAEKLGVSRQAVSKWERNEAYPDTENLIAISRFYNISIDDLINKSLSSEDAAVDNSSIDTTKERIEHDCDDDDDDDDEDDDVVQITKHGLNIREIIPYPVVITVIYLLWGFLSPYGWKIGWTLYVTIPIYYSLIDCIRRRRFSPFAYPVFITFIFLLCGMLFGVWHPLWVLYLTIPIYYSIASAIDNHNQNKRK